MAVQSVSSSQTFPPPPTFTPTAVKQTASVSQSIILQASPCLSRPGAGTSAGNPPRLTFLMDASVGLCLIFPADHCYLPSPVVFIFKCCCCFTFPVAAGTSMTRTFLLSPTDVADLAAETVTLDMMGCPPAPAGPSK